MIYVLRSQNGLKIGRAKNIASRLRNLRTADPSLLLLLEFPGDAITERAIHRDLQADRKYGEFFNDTPAVLERLHRFAQLYSDLL
jgi:hypothetical protein